MLVWNLTSYHGGSLMVLPILFWLPWRRISLLFKFQALHQIIVLTLREMSWILQSIEAMICLQNWLKADDTVSFVKMNLALRSMGSMSAVNQQQELEVETPT